MHDFELTDRAKIILNYPLFWVILIDILDYNPVTKVFGFVTLGMSEQIINVVQVLILLFAFKNPSKFFMQFFEFGTIIGIRSLDLVPWATLTYMLMTTDVQVSISSIRKFILMEYKNSIIANTFRGIFAFGMFFLLTCIFNYLGISFSTLSNGLIIKFLIYSIISGMIVVLIKVVHENNKQYNVSLYIIDSVKYGVAYMLFPFINIVYTDISGLSNVLLTGNYATLSITDSIISYVPLIKPLITYVYSVLYVVFTIFIFSVLGGLSQMIFKLINDIL